MLLVREAVRRSPAAAFRQAYGASRRMGPCARGSRGKQNWARIRHGQLAYTPRSISRARRSIERFGLRGNGKELPIVAVRDRLLNQMIGGSIVCCRLDLQFIEFINLDHALALT